MRSAAAAALCRHYIISVCVCVRLSSPFKLSFISFTCICLQVTRALRRLWHVTLFIFLRAILCAPALPKIHHKYPFPSSSPYSHCTVAFLIDTSLHSCLLSLPPSLHSRECKLDVVKGLVTIFSASFSYTLLFNGLKLC